MMAGLSRICFQRPPDDRNQVFVDEPFRDLGVDGNRVNELGYRGVKGLLLRERRPLLSMAHTLNGHAHCAIDARLFGDRRDRNEDVRLVRHRKPPLRNSGVVASSHA